MSLGVRRTSWPSGRNVRPERSPLHDVRQHAHGERPVDGTFRKTRIYFRMSRTAHSRTDIFRSLADGIAAGGARRDRTDDLLLAKQALSQLSYGPAPVEPPPGFGGQLQRERRLVGLGRFELPTSRLSSARSNQLSYRPMEHTLAPRCLKDGGQWMLQRPWNSVGSSEKKEKRRRRSPANRHANPETGNALMFPRDPIARSGCFALKDLP